MVYKWLCDALKGQVQKVYKRGIKAARQRNLSPNHPEFTELYVLGLRSVRAKLELTNNSIELSMDKNRQPVPTMDYAHTRQEPTGRMVCNENGVWVPEMVDGIYHTKITSWQKIDNKWQLVLSYGNENHTIAEA